MTPRIALMISTRNLMRFSKEPPHSSVRVYEIISKVSPSAGPRGLLTLLRGDMNWLIRYPWAPWISITSKPAWTAL